MNSGPSELVPRFWPSPTRRNALRRDSGFVGAHFDVWRVATVRQIVDSQSTVCVERVRCITRARASHLLTAVGSRSLPPNFQKVHTVNTPPPNRKVTSSPAHAPRSQKAVGTRPGNAPESQTTLPRLRRAFRVELAAAGLPRHHGIPTSCRTRKKNSNTEC